MIPDGPAIVTPASAGEGYHGHATVRISSPDLWLDVLATAGPRIVRLGAAGSPRNLLAETPDAGWQTPYGRYELFGGHRLWVAPEDPDRAAVPDGSGLVLESVTDGVRLTGPAEPPTGLVRSMTVRLAAGRAELEICHELRNVSEAPIELAPWAITQLPLGGIVLLPEPPASRGHHVRPNRTVVLWPYSSWEDPRFRTSDGLLTLRAESGPNFKLGYRNDAGWVAYVHDGSVLVRRFVPAPWLSHPDLGCNVEVFTGDRYLELELLGPLASLEPEATVGLVEHWEIRTTEPVEDDASLHELAGRLGDGRIARSHP